MPVAPALASVPVAQPVAAQPAPGLALGPEPVALVSPRRQARPRRRYGKWIVYGVLLLFCAGAMVGGTVFIYHYFRPEAEQTTQARHGNFRFERPGKEWKIDRGLESRMALQIALTRLEPRCHMALFYRDYQKRSPSEVELLEEALKKLRGGFRHLDYEDPFLVKDREGATLGGQPALAVEFQGLAEDNVLMRGQCTALTRRGYAYWFFTWGPADDRAALAETWAELRERFHLLNGREGWKELPPETRDFDGKALAYRLSYAKQMWTPREGPKDYDERAELVLLGYEPTRDEETGKTEVNKHAGRAAEVVVLVLPAAPGLTLEAANKNALDHLLQHQKKVHEGARITVATRDKDLQPLLDRDGDVGALKGHLSKLLVELHADNKRFGYLGVVNRPGEGVLVVYGECAWDRKDFWDRELQLLMASVRPRPKGGPARPPK
jgi:hypothetical protein